MYLPNKYTRIYDLIIANAKLRDHKKQPFDGYQTHHIIPRCMGGSDDPTNLVVLSYKEHRVCHRLLIGMTEGKDRYKMMYAYKLFNKNYDISWIPSRGIHLYKPEQYVKAVKTRKKRGSYKSGAENNFSASEFIQKVKVRMTNNNPMKCDLQKHRMKINNNNPYSVPIMVERTVFPSLIDACRYYNMSAYILKKTHRWNYIIEPKKEPKQLNFKDKYVTPYGVFKTKKAIQDQLKIPEWTLNTIYNNLDAYPTSNGRASKKMDHIIIDPSKTWRENGFSLLDDSSL